MDARRYAGLWMIMLVLSMPFYSSGAQAEILSVKVTGNNGAASLVKADYDLKVDATVRSSDNSSIDSNQVRLKQFSTGDTFNFDACTGTGNNTVCSITLKKGVNSNIDFCPGQNFNVELYEDVYGSPSDRRVITVYCDGKGPIVSLGSSAAYTRDANLSLNYNIIDPEDGSSSCSGVSKIEWYLNGLNGGAATSIINGTGCSASGSVILQTSSYADGIKTIYLKAYDKFDQAGIGNVTLTIDKTSPRATAKITLKDATNKDIVYFTSQTAYADIVLNISDLSGIQTYSLGYANLTSNAPSCSPQEGSTICTWTRIPIPLSNATVVKTITLSATDVLGNSGTQSIPLQFSVPVDSLPPSVTMTEVVVDTLDGVVPSWFRPGPMKMSFSATITEELSGIASVSADLSSFQIISGETPSCSGDSTYYTCEWDAVVFYMDQASLNKPVKVLAKDKANNQGSATKQAVKSFRADPKSPVISGFKIVEASGNNITRWIGNETVAALFSVDITEEGAGLEKVTLDLSKVQSGQSFQTGSCTQTSATNQQVTAVNTTGSLYVQYTDNSSNITLPTFTYTCTWSASFGFNESGNPLQVSFGINATDKSLNSQVTTVVVPFKVDITPPEVTALQTANTFDSISYVGGGANVFLAAVSDAGIGIINTSSIYLDASAIGLGISKADACQSDGCSWNLGPSTMPNGIYPVLITTDSADDIGNKIAEPFGINVTVDTVPPLSRGVTVTAVASSTDLYEGYIQTGNALYIIAEIQEDTGLFSATADLSLFILNETADLADDCQQSNSSNTTWTCTWATDAIDRPDYAKGNIYLNFTDLAGNSLIIPYELEVFEALPAGSYDYWAAEVGEHSPDAIDRQIVTKVTPSMLFQIGLKSTEGKSGSERWPLDLAIESCGGGDISVPDDASGTTEGSAEEIADNETTTAPAANILSSANGNMPLLLNQNTDSPGALPYNIYMEYQLEQSAPSEDSVDITCQIKIRTLVDGKKISPYENENVTVTVEYYNNPLGELNQNIKDEIEDVKDSWLVSQEWIGSITQIINIAKSVCGLVNNLIKVYQTFGLLASGLSTNPYTYAAGKYVGTTANGLAGMTESTWALYANNFCKFLNCQLFYGDSWGGGGNPESATGIMGDHGRFAGKWSQYWNPSDSLVLSVATLCVPGVLYNLQKARAIECNYAQCLKLTANGLPVQMCVKQRDYAWCNYVYGEAFNLVPFAGMLSQLMQRVKQILSQPAEMLGVAIKFACTSSCSEGTTCGPCLVAESLSLVLDVLCDLGLGNDQCVPFWEDFSVDDSACEGI